MAEENAAKGDVREAAQRLMRAMVARGRREVEKAASEGRTRLEARQLRRDQEALYQKLGREVARLVEGGEIDHPGVVRGVERIRELEDRLRGLGEDPEAGPTEPTGEEQG
jgi:hypothetical protein